jgi:hypothetical protein
LDRFDLSMTEKAAKEAPIIIPKNNTNE